MQNCDLFPNSSVSKKILFEGRIQGVGFRYSVKEIAKGFDVIGCVKNLPNGTVELNVKGEYSEVKEFLREIMEESEISRHIKSTSEESLSALPKGITGFTIC